MKPRLGWTRPPPAPVVEPQPLPAAPEKPSRGMRISTELLAAVGRSSPADAGMGLLLNLLSPRTFDSSSHERAMNHAATEMERASNQKWNK